jgi:predicted phosphohydrolase
MRRSVRTANEQMSDSIVLVFTGNDEALVSKWVKWVRDSDFACQNSGTMNCLPMPAENAQRLFTACSALPSSTILIRNSICDTSWSVSQIIR